MQPALRVEHVAQPEQVLLVGAAAVVQDQQALRRTGGGALEEGRHRVTAVRGFTWGYDAPPAERGLLGAGTVHHIAWASRDEDHLAWQRRVLQAGAQVSDVRDRDYFQSIYFGEPRGILFEIATLSPGFAVDEPFEDLGEELRLPRQHEHLRPQLEKVLRPVINPRTAVTR